LLGRETAPSAVLGLFVVVLGDEEEDSDLLVLLEVIRDPGRDRQRVVFADLRPKLDSFRWWFSG